MTILATFWWAQLRWTAILAAALVGVGAATGGGADVLASLPAWLGMAVFLAAFPAGLACATEYDLAGAAELGVFLAASLSVSAAAWGLVNGLAPALQPNPGLPDTAGMTLGALRELAVSLHETARGGPDTPDNWWAYNHVAFHYVRRTDALVVPALFAWIGLLTGWATATIRMEAVRRLAHWGLGLFLTVTTYFAGENGYELVVLRAGGPVEFVGDFVVIVPAAVLAGLTVGAVGRMFRDPDDDAA